MTLISHLKQEASQWFQRLQKQICHAFEKVELDNQNQFPSENLQPGQFVYSPWNRLDHNGFHGGGGIMAMMHGRVFEKVGVHTSVVHGEFAPEFKSQIAGAENDPRFWASGISVIAHPWNPHAPTVHMNTRLVVTTKSWFGGGADLTPMLANRRHQNDEDAQLFHNAMRHLCNQHSHVADYEKYKKWCDEYFYLPHRQEPRGIGGIFYDHLWTGDEQADFAFTRSVGETFLKVYLQIIERNRHTGWTPEHVLEQEVQRGRYVEFNLLYDRGTLFGLKTGGNVASILSSLPPRVRWP